MAFGKIEHGLRNILRFGPLASGLSVGEAAAKIWKFAKQGTPPNTFSNGEAQAFGQINAGLDQGSPLSRSRFTSFDR